MVSCSDANSSFPTSIGSLTTLGVTAFALNVHEALRDRLTRLLSTIESFCYAALDLEEDEINRQLLQQIGFFTRVLEAQAQAPVTIQEITRPYVGPRGVRDLDFEPPFSRRKGGGG